MHVNATNRCFISLVVSVLWTSQAHFTQHTLHANTRCFLQRSKVRSKPASWISKRKNFLYLMWKRIYGNGKNARTTNTVTKSLHRFSASVSQTFDRTRMCTETLMSTIHKNWFSQDNLISVCATTCSFSIEEAIQFFMLFTFFLTPENVNHLCRKMFPLRKCLSDTKDNLCPPGSVLALNLRFGKNKTDTGGHRSIHGSLTTHE